MRRAKERISPAEFTAYSIREICQKIEISTGMFYRHFRNKNDLLSFCYIDEVRNNLTKAERECEGRPLEEQLFILEMAVVRSSLFMGPEGIHIFLNNENPACDCSVSRGMTAELIIRAIEKAGAVLSEGNSPALVADRMTIILKGLIFEWFTKKDDPSFDFLAFSEGIYRAAIPSLLF